MNNNFNLEIKIDKIEKKLNNIENLLNKLLEKNNIFEDDFLFKNIPNMPMLRRMPAFNNQDNFDNTFNRQDNI
jgi:hypothetical protein